MSTRSVGTAIQVLEAVADHQPVGLSELTRFVDVPKATVYRSLVTLEEFGWLAQADEKWSLTIHAYAVASRGSRGSRIRDAAIGPLSALQLATGETIHLTVPDDRHMVLIERLDTAHALRAFRPLGALAPMHASSAGLAYLAAVDDACFEEYLAAGLEATTAATIVDPVELRSVRGVIRARGYSINEEGLSDGITSLGAAILDAGGRVAAAVSVSGPSVRVTRDHYDDYGRHVHETAREISATLQSLR
ncbi:IclR family transcriptional regulator [Microbacterium mangrovi]|uniref:IclR family transcriptional regulator n=1 Tax=Microbacterium mangrovi TaxID=1348253 RepID=A0A0B2A5R0_9MICO|nr:IclR family transcriptional regulator [Microbacterium mangrovi]KHK97094.1 IclR family transcriptional regulator [Microbacterium mangrovi]